MAEETIVIEFNGGSGSDDYIFQAELDDILNVDSNGDQLSGLTTRYIRVNKSSNVTIDEIVVTDGEISLFKSDVRSDEVRQLFSNRDSDKITPFSLPIIPSNVNIIFMGRTGKLDTVISTKSGKVSYSEDISVTPFLAKILYDYQVDIYSIAPPKVTLLDEETYDVYVVFYITVN